MLFPEKSEEVLHSKRRIEHPQETGWKRIRDILPMEVDKLPDMVIAIIVR